MVLRLRKIFVLTAFLVFFASNAIADKSELIISVDPRTNELFVERLFDDDGSIGFVEVCILELSEQVVDGAIPTDSRCFEFENVIEGQVLDIPLGGLLVFSGQQTQVVQTPLTQESLLPELLQNSISDCGNEVCEVAENCLNCVADCSVCSSNLVAAYYNFIDVDGQTTNSKFLIFASDPHFAPALTDTTIDRRENVVVSKSLTPKISADNKSFEVQVRLKTNQEIQYTEQVVFFWKLSESTNFLSERMVESEQGEWTLTIGPFNQPITLKSAATIEFDGGQQHVESFSPRVFHFLLPNGQGICETAVFSSANKPLQSSATTLNGPKSSVFLQSQQEQPGWGETISRIRMVPRFLPNSDDFAFRVRQIRDEVPGTIEDTDITFIDDIDFLDVFVIKEDSISHYYFEEVGIGTNLPLQEEQEGVLKEKKNVDGLLFQIIGDAGTGIGTSTESGGIGSPSQGSGDEPVVPPFNYQFPDISNFPIEDPSGAEIFYNFMDLDGSIGNMNLLLEINPADITDTVKLVPEDRVQFIENVEMKVVPTQDCSAYNLAFTASIPESQNVQRVYLKYGFSNYSLSAQSSDYSPTLTATVAEKNLGNPSDQEFILELQEVDGGFEGEIGPFSSTQLEFFSRIYAQNPFGTTSVWQNLFSWIGFGKGGEGATLTEICGNGIDDNGDGVADESCILLPDLLFVGKTQIPAFVTVGEPIEIVATLKNAGISNTSAFKVSFFINNNLIDVASFDGLVEGQEAQAKFLISDSTAFLGLNKAKVEIDPTDEVPELNSNNNTVEQEISVGFNTFNIILNFNNADFLGDVREFRAFSSEFGVPEENVKTLITFPSGKTQDLLTDQDGINKFQLTESGIYFLAASKDKFEPFEALFSVKKIVLKNLARTYELGSVVSFSVETDDEQKISDALVEVTDPNNQTMDVALNQQAAGEFLTRVGGIHKISVSRNGVAIFEESILVAGFIESVLVSSSLEQVLFGSIVQDTPLFITLLLFSFTAAVIAFSRSKFLFNRNLKSTRQQQLENVARMFIAIAFFLLPFQVSNILGFNAGLATVIVEVMLAFGLEYYKKSLEASENQMGFK